MTLIYEFEELDKALKNVDDNTALYLYLSWLGLSHKEIIAAETGDYNQRMRMLHTGGRAVYVKEDKIAAALEKASRSNEIKIMPDPDPARLKAEQAGVSPVYVYKMGYFKEKLDLKRRKQPEDLMRFKAMIRYIGEDEQQLADEFKEYENNSL